MVERICKRDLLPPIESELAGKDWRTLEGLATYYFKKAFRQERYSHTTLGSKRRLHKEKGVELLARANTILTQVNILHAMEIFDDPNSSPKELQFANGIAWMTAVNKAFDSQVPSPPGARAKIIGWNNSIPSPDKPTIEEIERYERWFGDNWERILQEVLDKLPDPDGVIHKASEFYRYPNEKLD